MIEWFKVISLNNMIYIPRLLHFLGHWLRQLGQDVQLPLSHSLTSPCVMGLACFCAVWLNWHQSSMPRYWWIVRSPSGIIYDKCSVGTRTTEGQNVDFFFFIQRTVLLWNPERLICFTQIKMAVVVMVGRMVLRTCEQSQCILNECA